MLEAEGSAVAFPEVFQQVREDMKHVQRRLEVTDVGAVTQAIEKDIIDTLKEMIEALKKARKENDDKKSPSRRARARAAAAGPEAARPDRRAENDPVDADSRQQPHEDLRQDVCDREGEQAADPNMRRELHNLAERQERISEITNRIAKGDNK